MDGFVHGVLLMGYGGGAGEGESWFSSTLNSQEGLIMFEARIDCPVAIAHGAVGIEDGIRDLLKWLRKTIDVNEMEGIVLWAPTKSAIERNDFARRLAHSNDVRVATGHEPYRLFARDEAVLAYLPHREHLSAFNDNPKMKALMVLTWGQPLNVWSKEVGATVISDGVPDFYQGGMLPALPEAAVEILSSCGQIINHNNTITGGYEKRDVKRALDELKMRGLINEIDRDSVVEWAAANGWLWGNPKILGEYVEKYQSGRTIRV
ncbi:hypothetical protein [Corynebacterium diphtheriae]|uniref:hypothetical protein n=1 Tax=Corynebacterium diphtheriae TaxID=1717 RepID=UPI000B4AE187|nr:hypothetical protein [Corynebacterium diphtheriae]OWN70133.1 hypothetical protein AY518_09575 [Corynebacterium diphtheriae bv. gravis]